MNEIFEQWRSEIFLFIMKTKASFSYFEENGAFFI